MVPSCLEDSMKVNRHDGAAHRTGYCRKHWIEVTKVGMAATSVHKKPKSPRKFVNGYAWILIGNQYEAEHRVVMERVIGRRLTKTESVHHLNGQRDDNRPENLELWVGPLRSGVRAHDLQCPHCGRQYVFRRELDSPQEVVS